MAEIGTGEEISPTRQELRQFSKKKEAELAEHAFARRDMFPRHATAEAIKSVRASARIGTSQLSHSQGVVEKNAHELQEYVAKAQDLQEQKSFLEQQLSDQQTKLVNRITAFFKPELQEEKVEDLQRQLTDVSRWTAQAERFRQNKEGAYKYLVDELQKAQESNQRSRERPQEILDKFYDDTLQQYTTEQKLQKDRAELEGYKKEHGSVKDVIQQHNVYFVHATNPSIKKAWDNNPFLKEGITWQEKVACVLVQEPSISSSSVLPGNFAATWAPLGVVLKDGGVDDAHPGDNGTSVTQSGERSSSDPPRNIPDYEHRIEVALANKSSRKYNEFIVSHPKAAGLFLNLDEIRSRLQVATGRQVNPEVVYHTTHFSSAKELISYADIFEAAEQFQMPVFVFDNGTAYEATLDLDTKSILRGREVPPQEMSQREYTTLPDNSLIEEMGNQALRPETLV